MRAIITKIMNLMTSAIVTKCRAFLLVTSMVVSMPGLLYALPAFPGAEGFGSSTIGGRGGQVLMVTNLNDSGSGSLRAALEASGPRIVVFRTGGTISLASPIYINNPYITIAGQTAPGDGITIRDARITVNTHDVIIRNLRFRPGPAAIDGLEVAGKSTVNNVVVDHCSMSWAIDENLSTWYNPKNVTFQWNIISEGLNGSGGGGLGMLIGGYNDGDETLAANNISVHHNLFAHNRDRSARIKQNTKVEFINNLVYGWEWYATRTSSAANIIGNYYKTSPAWTGGKPVAIAPYVTLQDKTVYVKNNLGPGRTKDSDPEWNIVNGDSRYQATSPPFPLSNVTVEPAGNIFDKIIAGAGTIAPARDSVDERVVNDVINGTGTWNIQTQNDVGGWPVLDRGTPQADSDLDGMPDQWEIAAGLNRNDPSDASKDRNGDGYTNVEEYINSLVSGGTNVQIEPPTNLRIINN